MSFRARDLTLQFDAKGNVEMEYDLKMWVWQGPTPMLHTIGTFNGTLQLQHSKMHWPDNQVRTRTKQAKATVGMSLWVWGQCWPSKA